MFQEGKIKKLYFWIRNCTFGPKCLDFSVSPWCTFKNLIFSYWDGTHRAPIFNKFNICWIQWQTLQSRYCNWKQTGLIPDFTFLRHAQKSEKHKQALHGITSTRTMTTMTSTLTDDVKPKRGSRRLNGYHSDHVSNGVAFHDSEGENRFFKGNGLRGRFGFGDPFNMEASGWPLLGATIVHCLDLYEQRWSKQQIIRSNIPSLWSMDWVGLRLSQFQSFNICLCIFHVFDAWSKSNLFPPHSTNNWSDNWKRGKQTHTSHCHTEAIYR